MCRKCYKQHHNRNTLWCEAFHRDLCIICILQICCCHCDLWASRTGLNSVLSATSVLFSVRRLSSCCLGQHLVKCDLLSSPVSWARGPAASSSRACCLPSPSPVPLAAPWCLSGLRFSQTAASLQIIIRRRPAGWHTSTGLLLLIELGRMLEPTEKWTVSPSELCD